MTLLYALLIASIVGSVCLFLAAILNRSGDILGPMIVGIIGGIAAFIIEILIRGAS